jgi:hypothetical protein
MRAVLGLRAMRGGAVIVAVGVEGGEPHLFLSSFLPTADEGDRLSREPYHVAAELAAGGAAGEAERAVADGRARQRALAVEGLEAVTRGLREQGGEPVIAALLVNRAGWVTDLLAYSLASPDHPPVAEGLAVRDALRSGLGKIGLDIVEIDEKSLGPSAADALGRGPSDLDAQLKRLGTDAGKPWRKEQKSACLAAWLAAAGTR